MSPYHPYTIFPLGDAALLIDFGTAIDEEVSRKVLGLYHQLQAAAYPAITGLVPAYNSLTVHYDVTALSGSGHSPFERLARWIGSLDRVSEESPGRLHTIPVCYSSSFAPDLASLAQSCGLAEQEVIERHSSATYRVYMIGFLPGFAYLGSVDEAIAAPRHAAPRAVAAGSVGIAGRQTGIYPLASPGGWQVIGRTPLAVFRPQNEEPALLAPGDTVKFYSISEDEFAHYQGRTA